MRAVFFMVVLTGCVGVGKDTGGDLEACELAAESTTCPECSDGPVQCSFGGVSEVRASCGGCQARSALFQALCDAGDDTPAAEIEAGTVCVSVSCEWTYNCGCTPTCSEVASSTSSSTAADAAPCTPCATPEDPVGECAWTGVTCAATR